MYSQKPSSRQAPGIFSYIGFFSSRLLAYSFFFGAPLMLTSISIVFFAIFQTSWTSSFFIQLAITFTIISSTGLVSVLLFYKKAPILGLPPKGYGVQLNFFFTSLIGGSYLFGNLMEFIFHNRVFQEIFLMLGIILTYIIAFVIYYSFTTVDKTGTFILSFVQPILSIFLYSIFTFQLNVEFLFKALIFFSLCVALFSLPYSRGFAHVSKIYKEATGLGGYTFIRAFVLSLVTDNNDDRIEELFDNIGVNSSIRIQYIFLKSQNLNKIKGLFLIPHVHFGPFKTCGSSDLPEILYKAFITIPGTTVYHTTNDHAQNLTSQIEVNKLLNFIKSDIKEVESAPDSPWESEIIGFSRKISNSAKLMGAKIGNTPLIFLTRHPLPSDDIQKDIGDKIREHAKQEGFKDVVIIDSHNSIIDDEILIEKETIEASDLINVAKKFFKDERLKTIQKDRLLYGVAKDPCKEYSERDGIGKGGIVVHMFKNTNSGQRTVLVHFDGNNAYIDIRSYVLNMLQNRGIEKGEITTSDSHTVARQITSRGYSPIGDRIKIDYILSKLNILLKKAEKDLEPIEFLYKDSIIDNIRIWGNEKYFNVIMNTLQECIRVSQRLLTLGLVIPTFLCFFLLFFLYNAL
ncbi:MAG: DUF2070 family protein [Candidatus Lokiarchaeota archaeon]|nr:DUF2070 family protein [Candidatus Lokiarchaeota archaeon]